MNNHSSHSLKLDKHELNNFGKINIILGKNGCGKSTLLRKLDVEIHKKVNQYGKSKYITPERGGVLVQQSGIEDAMNKNPAWLSSERRKNQANHFREQTVAQYKNLELKVLRMLEEDPSKKNFVTYIEKINSLLDNIEIKRAEITFDIFKKGTETKINANEISSGESELIALGIECLVFSKECNSEKENYLFLDEPDVHLHPDLQVRLMHFLLELVNENNFKIFIATHSTAILGALESFEGTYICFMKIGQSNLMFNPISEEYRKILPMFGAHPLSNIFNEAPILLLEGEDDERIWQQVVRSSEGRIKLFPCSTGSITQMENYENHAKEIIDAIYENANGFSLRDRDDTSEDIDDKKPIIRMKLSCRCAENLILTDEVLASQEVNWHELKQKIEDWLKKNKDHNHYKILEKFKNDGWSRKDGNIKKARNDILGIIGTDKPWEVIVGQTIAKLDYSNDIDFNAEGSLFSFLGMKVAETLLNPKNSD